jgi:hypothetical protein
LQNNGWTALAAEVSKLQHLMQAALLQAQKNGTALKAVNAKVVRIRSVPTTHTFIDARSCD